jgi:hypothetical protein
LIVATTAIPTDVKEAIRVVDHLSTILDIRPDLALLNLREALDQIDQSDFADANRLLLDQTTKLLNEFESSLRHDGSVKRPRAEIVKEIRGKCSRLRRKAESFAISTTEQA